MRSPDNRIISRKILANHHPACVRMPSHSYQEADEILLELRRAKGKCVMRIKIRCLNHNNSCMSWSWSLGGGRAVGPTVAHVVEEGVQ